MKVLFTSGNAYLPQQSGGVESSTDSLAKRMIKQGLEPAVLSRLHGGGKTELMSRLQRFALRRQYALDRELGYPVFRTWEPSDVSEVVKRFKPDVAVIQSGNVMRIARSLTENNIPVVFYFRNVEFDELGGSVNDIPGAQYIANSKFTAKCYDKRFGVRCHVIPPLIEPSIYSVETARECVTFVNPHLIKGLSVAADLAKRCPEIPFEFVESWGLDEVAMRDLNALIDPLSNVVFRRRVRDMRPVYRRTRVLLAPSQWEEAWGRVVSEAQCSGIPALSSDRGGLPEAVGPGGIIVPHDAPIDQWVNALKKLWHDQVYYDTYSKLALHHSQRAELKPEVQYDSLIAVLEKAISNYSKFGDRKNQ